MDADGSDPLSLEYTLLLAMVGHDAPVLEWILAAEFVFASNVHRRQHRAEWLALIARYTYIDARLLDLSRLKFGDTSIVHGRLKLNALVAGQPLNGLFNITDVWVKRDKRWQLVSRISAPEV